MSYTYSIEYELTEPLTDLQLVHMQQVLRKPWTPPPGYTGEVLKATIWQSDCDCSEGGCTCTGYPITGNRIDP